MKSTLTKLQEINIIDAEYGDLKLQVYPFDHGRPFILPKGFEIWEEQDGLELQLKTEE